VNCNGTKRQAPKGRKSISAVPCSCVVKNIFFFSEVIYTMYLFTGVYEMSIILSDLHLPEKEYIFLPVNNNNSLELAGGDHW